jgi:hypothetical protein
MCDETRQYERRVDGTTLVRAWRDGDTVLFPVRYTSPTTGRSVVVGEYGSHDEAEDVASWLGAEIDEPVILSGA